MPQAFKGAITAHGAATAMAIGAEKAIPSADTEAAPMADGGDNTLDVLIEATNGRYVTTKVEGPLGEDVRARWGVLGDGETAVIEMAEASGLRLLKTSDRNPRIATTVGTGQLIHAALGEGYRNLIVGIGGSATVDAGAGAAAALGARFFDTQGNLLAAGGSSLINLRAINTDFLDRSVREASIRVACDVNIPLCGPLGAWKFAAQKGASPATSLQLARALEQFAQVVRANFGLDLRSMPFAGPGGGISGGMHAILGAELVSGPKLVMDTIGADARIASADLVIIGEGRMDANTFWGKGPSTVARSAQKAGVPVIAVVGQLGDDVPDLAHHGIVEVTSLIEHVGSEREAIDRSSELIVEATESVLSRYARTRGLNT